MTRFNATQGAQISKQIEEVVERPRLGRVVEVFEHVSDDDKSNFEVDVELLDTSTKQLRSIAWQAPQNDEVHVPKVGDKVVVEYRGRSKKVPIARNAVYTNEDRPPKATAGTWRKRVESGESPAGSGDLYIESNTRYDTDPGDPSFQPDEAVPESAMIRIAKKVNGLYDTRDDADVPVAIEFVDDPNGDSAHVKVQIEKVDGSDSSATWGMVFDIKTGEFKMLDGEGYGIVSDGRGNFTWHYEGIEYSQGTTTSL
jgi:hypothetical protein